MYGTMNLKSQKGDDLIYTAVEARHYTVRKPLPVKTEGFVKEGFTIDKHTNRQAYIFSHRIVTLFEYS